MTEITSLDEISVRNQVVVVVNGEDKYFPISQLNLDFENSTDDEVFDAVNRVLSEGGEQVPKDGYVIQRSANNGNILAFPKTELGANYNEKSALTKVTRNSVCKIKKTELGWDVLYVKKGSCGNRTLGAIDYLQNNYGYSVSFVSELP